MTQFPPCFIIEVTTNPERNTNSDTIIKVTLCKTKETKSVELKLFVPVFTMAIKDYNNHSLPIICDHNCSENI